MSKLSIYSQLTTTPADTDTVPALIGGVNYQVPIPNLIRASHVTVGPAGSFADYVCDGAADDVEIQAAVTAVNSAGGGIVQLLKGTYTLTTRVSLVGINYVTVKGAGIGATTLMNRGFVKNDNTTTYGVKFQDLTININNQTGSNTQAIQLFNNSYNFRIKNVELKNTGDRFLLSWGGTDNLIVENCIFYDGGLVSGQDNCAGSQLTTTNNTSIFKNNLFVKEFSAGGGMLTTGQTGNLLIEGNSFVDLSNNSYAAVSIENQAGNSKCVQIVNNKSYRVGYQLGVSGNSNTIDKGIIANNIQEGVAGANSGSGITTNRVKDLLISGNTISDTSYGIYSSGNIYAKIIGNKIKNTNSASSGFPSDKAGLYLTGNTVVEASNNTVWDDTGTTPYGIRIVGGSQKVYLDNNKLLGPFVTNSIQTTSTLTFLSANNNDYSGGIKSFGTITSYYTNNNIGLEL